MDSAGPALNAWTTIPKALPHEVVREEALQRLSQVGTACVVLLAASGYGKSTLLAQYARNTRRSVAWLTASEDDVQLGTLLPNIRAAFHTGTSIRLALPPHTSLTAALHDLAAHLTGVGGGVDFILDQAELITPIHGQELAALVRVLPQGHRLILAGMDLSGFPLARLVAAGLVTVFTHADLRFTGDETRRYLQGHGREAEADHVQTAMEGWPVGVVLSALDGSRHIHVNDLLQDVLDRLEEPLRRALPELALLDEWSEAASVALDVALPDGWLRSLRAAGLPLTPLGHGVFRPHSLLRSLLRGQLERHPDRARALYRRSALVAAEQGNTFGAVRHAALARDVPLLEEYASRLFPALWRQREFTLLAELTAMHRGDPPTWWQEYAAVARIETGQGQAGLAALSSLLEAGTIGTLGLAALSLNAARQGEFSAQLALARRGLERPEGLTELSLRLQEASALISLERPEEGLAVTTGLVAQAAGRSAPLDEANGLVFQAYALQMLRRWDERDAALDRARELFLAQREPERALQIDTQRIDVLLLRGQRAEAAALLEASLAQAERSQPIHLPTLHLARVWLALTEGNVPLAMEALSAADAAISGFGLQVLRPFYHFSAFDVLSVGGRAALAGLAFGAGVAAATLPLFRTRLVPFFDGVYAFDQQEDVRARASLGVARVESVDRIHALRAQVLLLALDERAGQLRPEALQALALALAPHDVEAVCCADLRRVTPLVRHVAARQPLHPLAALARILPVPVSGGFTVTVGRGIECAYDGAPLKLPLAKSGEVLVWLLLHDGGSLHELLDDLWDGSRDPRHHEYFRVAVRRLRATLRDAGALEFDPLPHLHGRYQLHPELRISLNLTRVMERARAGEVTALLQVRPDGLLPEIGSSWVEALRSRVVQAQDLALRDLEHHVAPLHPDRAVAVLTDALRAQPTAEALHLTLIRVLLALRPAQAPAAYRAYVQMLAEDLGVEPDPGIVQALVRLGLPAPQLQG